ncbi:MAG TPA: alanine racemase [Tepidisphaeraceae bacterium]|nr:alanine racemase [Tepidisphaeraceae bacterium]
MQPSPNVTVRVNLARIRQNLQAIKLDTGAAVLAVVKADAYGLGAMKVAEAIGDLADGFCVFRLQEAIDAQLWQRTKKRVIALGPPEPALDPEAYIENGVTPAVTTPEQARALRAAHPAICIDTGMQRFACPPAAAQFVVRAGDIHEAFTHGTRIEHVERLKDAIRWSNFTLHAAASALLHEPAAYLDAVRPGAALYQGAVHVSTPLVEAHIGTGPAGYSGFVSAKHGVILCGYSNGLRKGVCWINGRTQKILEVGMQSAFIELSPYDRVGDEVVLLGESNPETIIAEHWRSSSQEVVVALASSGTRVYVD